MSIQACKIRGYGYKFNYKDNIFSFIKDADIEYDYLNIIGKNFSYYDFRDWQSQDKKNIEPLLAVVIDGMNGEYKYVVYVENAHYIENTLGDAYWDIYPRFDDWVKDHAQEKIEIFLQRKLDRKPQMFDFENWS